VVTPAGTLESRRLPGSGAGPSPDRMFIGSEGILGIITEAWVRLRKKPTFRTSASVRFKTFFDGADAVMLGAMASGLALRIVAVHQQWQLPTFEVHETESRD
jgi:alkyldihydroxyacetonephosphate synthase